MFSYNYKPIKRFHIVSGLILLFILSSFEVSHSADKEYQECIRPEKESYENAVNWFPKIRDKSSFSKYSCQPMHSAQEYPPKQCCDTYYATRNNPGMWDEAWYVLQECGWKEEIKKRKEAYYKKAEICRQKYPQKGVETSQQSSALVDILNRLFGVNIPLSQAIREISGRDAAIIGRDSSGNFYAINNRGVKIPLPGSLAKGFISNQFAVLADDSFIPRALSTIPLLASSEHSSVRGTINGGGDFVYLQNQPNYIWMKENGVIQNYQLGSSIYLASSEHGSIKGTINGGGDFVKVMQEKVIETPFTKITLIGTKVVVDLGFNGVTGVLVLEGQAHVKELSTNTEKHVRAGEAVLIVPGHGISDASPVSNMNVTQWWKGSDLTVAKSDTPVSSHMRTLREQEPNEEEHEAMRIQPGDIVKGTFSIDRAIATRRGNDMDRYLVKLAPGINKITFTPLVAECNYWLYYGGNHLYPKGSEGPFSLIVEVSGQKKTDFYVEVNGKREKKYGRGDDIYELPIILETRIWSNDSSKGFKCVQNGKWYREIPYRLTFTGGKETKPDISKVWIEAEDEIESYVSPVRPAPNTKEINPSWRPPYFGKGCWYLAAGGEFLKYRFSVPKDGLYYVWVRDYVDRFQPKGVRKIIVEFDSRKYGVFPEVDIPAPGDKGALGWHKIGNGIWLTRGEHIMKIIKEATTSGAAIIDAYYLTIDPNDAPPEK
ncbi:MAG: hypothetical protein AUJ60_07375 [Nitrospirae bacterium CG1_02_44_142]|nr:MAG: hypothetical protein AUJ60_07375 [Nitrospirae bacterium CG1_02_44_142]